MSSNKFLFINGVFWTGVQAVVSRSVGFVIKIILAKLLFPEEFGLVGMATVVISFLAVLSDLGFNSALIQFKSEKLNDIHFHTAFWAGLGWASGLYVLLVAFGGPLAAEFYDRPILKQLVPVLGLGLLANALLMVQKARLARSFEFKKIAVIENISSITAGILSLALAFAGFGVWALVFNSLVTILVAVPMYFWSTAWIPRFNWDWSAFRSIFGFGAYTTGTSFVNYFIGNGDFLVIGKLLGASALGVYSVAFLLTDTFRGQLMSVTNSVLYPLYGKEQDNAETLKRYYLKVIEYNSLVVYPMMLFLLLFGESFVLTVLGEKWIDAIEPMRILALAIMFHMMVNSNTVLIRGLGRPGLEFKLQLLKAIVFIPSVLLGTHINGVIGCAWAVVINKVFAVLLAQYTFNKFLTIKISTREFFGALKVPVAGTAVSAFVAVLSLMAGGGMIIGGALLAIVYCFVVGVWLKDELWGHYNSYRHRLHNS